MKTKKYLVLVATLVLACCVALLVGCGKGGNEPSGTDNTPAPANTTPTPTDTTPNYNTTITYQGKEYSFNLLTPGTITVATSPDFPPFDNLDGEAYVGFDMVIMNAVAAELGLQVKYTTVNFDAIITAVAAGAPADMAPSGITISEERKQEVDFTSPYYSSNLAIIVTGDSSFKSAADLEGKKIGSQSGTTGQAWAEENIKGLESITFTTVPDGLNALKAGKVDAFVTDLPVAQNMVASSFSDCKIIQEIATGDEFGFAVNKANPELTAAISAALATLEQNGTLDKLETKWLSDYTSEA